MPRPNKNWEKKYGASAKQQLPKSHRLSGADTMLAAVTKLTGYSSEAYEIVMNMMLNRTDQFMILISMDAMNMYDDKVVHACNNWAKQDLHKLAQGIKDVDPELKRMVQSSPAVPRAQAG